MKPIKSLLCTIGLFGVFINVQANNIQSYIADLNQQLVDENLGIAVAQAELLTLGDSGEMGQTIIFRDLGNKQLALDWVPNDPRRVWGTPDGITYAIDAVDTLQAVSGAEGEPPVTLLAGDDIQTFRDVMGTWDNVNCSDVVVADGGNVPVDIGIVENTLLGSGNPGVVADIVHAGWLPPSFFNLLQPGGGDGILGVTFTFRFVNPDGSDSDIDNNGKVDVAVREIYYNTNFPWVLDPNDALFDNQVDLYTVAVHEAGHAFSMAHFGNGFVNKQGKIIIAPQVIMNAAITIGHREITSADNAGFCSNWANWPNN